MVAQQYLVAVRGLEVLLRLNALLSAPPLPSTIYLCTEMMRIKHQKGIINFQQKHDWKILAIIIVELVFREGP